jgi:hypothetical protein
MSSRFVSGWVTAISGIVTLVATGAAGAVNPGGLYFQDDANAPYTNIQDFYGPTALLVTGRCNRTDAHFTQARAAGAEVLAYIDPVDIMDSGSPCQMEFYAPAQLWKDANGNTRSNYSGTHLGDLSVGSSWSDAVVTYVENLMQPGSGVDGVFLDVVGARLWGSPANFSTWPTTEQQVWTAGNVDLVRRLNNSRKRINPFFILVNNNYWNPDDTPPPAEPGAPYDGEQYVDGIVIQHHDHTSLTAQRYAARPYGSPGAGLEHRRVLAMAESRDDASAWTSVTGVTHVSVAGSQGYKWADTPIVPPTPLPDRPHWFGRIDYGATTSAGMTADYKRASRFTLSQNGTLDSLWAYLDGGGATSGTQELRGVLYHDNNGVPGTKVTESNSKYIAAGAPGGWRELIVPHVALTQGSYWIAIFSGATSGVARNYSDASRANWYGNADTFTDGAASPFGTGTAGSVELSVFATYTTP